MSRGRAGAAARQGRTAGPDGPFVLAPGLSAPGAVPLDEAVALAAAELDRQGAAGIIDTGTARAAGIYARRLAAYALAAHGVTTLAGVDRDVAELYIHSANARGEGGGPGRAALGTKHSRRGYVRQLFRVCRRLGLDDRDPTADVVLLPRPVRLVRALTDAEMLRCQDAAFRTTTETRLPCALALARSGATTSEAPRMTVDDVCLDHRRAWAHGGGARTLPRWLALDDWSAEQVVRRLRWLDENPPNPQELMSRGGRLGEVIVDARGDRNWVPLQITKLVKDGNPGAYRFYQMLTIPCHANDAADAGAEASHSYRLPLVQTDDDTTAGLNRSEHLRQLPPDTKAYARTYGRRPPAESDNSQRERRYVFQRIPAYGPEQQTLVMLLGSLLDNSKSRWIHQRRQQAEQQAS